MRASTCAAFIVAAAAAACSAQVQLTGAQSLHIQSSARSAGLADCTLAVLDDAMASSWNPGGLAFVSATVSGAATFSRLVPDWRDVYYLYGAAALKATPWAVVAASLTYLSYGEQVITDPDSPEPIGTFEPYESVPAIACAARLGDRIGIGVNVKYIYVSHAPPELTQEQTAGDASALATDIGLEYRTTIKMQGAELQLRGAGAVRNLGGELQYADSEAAPLPRSATAGASAQLSLGQVGHLLACAQYDRSLVEDRPRDQERTWGAGAELEVSLLGLAAQLGFLDDLDLRDAITGRVGYYKDEHGLVEGVSAGFGLGVAMREAVRLQVDLANVPQAEGLTRPWRIGGSCAIMF